MSAPTTVTAAVLVIGDEILSGRTKDKNIGYIAEYLGKLVAEGAKTAQDNFSKVYTKTA